MNTLVKWIHFGREVSWIKSYLEMALLNVKYVIIAISELINELSYFISIIKYFNILRILIIKCFN